MTLNALTPLLTGLLLATTPHAAADPGDAALRTETFSVDGQRIHYRIGGRGPHLLLLHGFTLTGEEWAPFLDDFMQHYTVIVPDLPGHGHSSDVDGHYDFQWTAKAMLALLDAVGARRVSGIGHSAGGITLLQMTLQQAARFDALVLVDAPHRFGKQGLDVLRSETYESLSDEMLAFYRGIQPRGDAQIKRLHDQAVWLTDDHEDFSVSRAALARITVPTLVVWGDRDAYFPVETAVELYRALPEARLWIVPGQGHTPVFEYLGGSAEAARVFPAVVTRFLGESAAGAPAAPH